LNEPPETGVRSAAGHAPAALGAELLYLSAVEIAGRVAAGTVSARDVVSAHIARIEQVDRQLNAVVIPLFEQAMRDAAAADEWQAQGKVLGPLHGVPITIKECFHVAGTLSSIGIGRLTQEPMTEEGPLVRRLRQAGAIVLGKTNVPQLMLLHETDSPVYGRTNNPWNLDRSPGGSSGGEAAIIAAGGSALGLASDLGGSIRQPAHCCGIQGLLPTAHRLSIIGKRSNLAGMEALSMQPGPLARHVADLELALRVLAEPGNETDPYVAPVRLGESAAVRIESLRIGMWTSDGYFPASPALRRSVVESAAALRARGATVEEFDPPDVAGAVGLYFGLFSADGAADLRRLLGSSRRDWRINRLVRLGGAPGLVRQPLTWLLSRIGQRRLAQLIGCTGGISADAYWRKTAARAAYTRRFARAMAERRLDVLIFPPHALPALKHGSSMHLPTAASYCFLANLMGMPAGVVAATRVRATEETDRPASRDVVERDAREVEIGSAGLPVGVQVMAPHWREDVVLSVMAALEEHFRRLPDYPLRPPI